MANYISFRDESISKVSVSWNFVIDFWVYGVQ